MSAENTFGTPITDPDRAKAAAEAYDKMNDGRNLQAQSYLQNEAAKFGTGIKALSLIYNATGQSVTVGDSHDWHGVMFDSYPLIIQNGQWGAFLHTKTSGAIAGSEAAVIYHGKTKNEEDCDILIAHDIPYIGGNRAYTDIGNSGKFTDWDDILSKLEVSSGVSSATYEGIVSVASIDVGTTLYFRTVLAYEASTKEFKTN